MDGAALKAGCAVLAEEWGCPLSQDTGTPQDLGTQRSSELPLFLLSPLSGPGDSEISQGHQFLGEIH